MNLRRNLAVVGTSTPPPEPRRILPPPTPGVGVFRATAPIVLRKPLGPIRNPASDTPPPKRARPRSLPGTGTPPMRKAFPRRPATPGTILPRTPPRRDTPGVLTPTPAPGNPPSPADRSTATTARTPLGRSTARPSRKHNTPGTNPVGNNPTGHRPLPPSTKVTPARTPHTRTRPPLRRTGPARRPGRRPLAINPPTRRTPPTPVWSPSKENNRTSVPGTASNTSTTVGPPIPAARPAPATTDRTATIPARPLPARNHVRGCSSRWPRSLWSWP